MNIFKMDDLCSLALDSFVVWRTHPFMSLLCSIEYRSKKALQITHYVLHSVPNSMELGFVYILNRALSIDFKLDYCILLWSGRLSMRVVPVSDGLLWHRRDGLLHAFWNIHAGEECGRRLEDKWKL